MSSISSIGLNHAPNSWNLYKLQNTTMNRIEAANQTQNNNNSNNNVLLQTGNAENSKKLAAHAIRQSSFALSSANVNMLLQANSVTDASSVKGAKETSNAENWVREWLTPPNPSSFSNRKDYVIAAMKGDIVDFMMKKAAEKGMSGYDEKAALGDLYGILSDSKHLTKAEKDRIRDSIEMHKKGYHNNIDISRHDFEKISNPLQIITDPDKLLLRD